jgi:hypothetical protein
MTIPKEISSYHTVWVRSRDGHGRAVSARYATNGEHVYCFGDAGLAEVLDGERVAATVHRIADGPPLFEFWATVRTVAPDKVDPEVLSELLEHMPLGRTLSEVQHSLDDQRQHRRIVELVA